MHFLISLFHKVVQFSRYFRFQINDLWIVTGWLRRKCYFFSFSPTFPSAGCLPNCIYYSNLTFAPSNQFLVLLFSTFQSSFFSLINSYISEPCWMASEKPCGRGNKDFCFIQPFWAILNHLEVERHWVICGGGGNSLPHPLLNFYFLKKPSSNWEFVSTEDAMWDLLKVLNIEEAFIHK